ncbi:MAG: fibronectin type III domain-containing protein [Thermoplasmata archaeon]
MKASSMISLLLMWVLISGAYIPQLTPKNVSAGSTMEWTWKYETNSTVKGISITDDGKYIGAYDYANNIYLFEADTGSLVKTWQFGAEVKGIKIAKKADPPLLFVSDNKSVRVYRQDMNVPARVYSPNIPLAYGWNASQPRPGNITGFDISADGKLLMVTYYYRWGNVWKYNVSMYDVERGTEMWNYQAQFSDAKAKYGLSASYDGKFFVVGVSETDTYVRIELYERDSPYGPKWQSDRLRDNLGSGYLSRITALSISNDGSVIMVGTNNAVLKFIQTQNVEVWRVDGIRDPVAISMNYSGSEGIVAFYNQKLDKHMISFMDLATMNDSKRIKWNWSTPDDNRIVNAVMDKEGQYIVVSTAKNMWLIYAPVHKAFRSIQLSTDFELVSNIDLSRDSADRVALGAAYREIDNPAGVYMFDNPKAIKPQPCEIFGFFDVTTTSMNVTWGVSTAPDFQQYELYCDPNLNVISTNPQNAEKHFVITNKDKNYQQVTGLQPGTTYFFKLRVVCITELYADSQVKQKMTEVPPPPPDYTPYIVAAVVVTALVIFLLWYFYLRHKIPEWKEKRKKKGKGVAWHQRPGEYLPPGFE